MRCEGLSSEHRAIVRHWRFKAFRVDTPLWELARFLARIRIAHAGDVAEDISESTAEDVAFVLWHLQRFLDGVSEAVTCETEVIEHGENCLSKTSVVKVLLESRF